MTDDDELTRRFETRTNQATTVTVKIKELGNAPRITPLSFAVPGSWQFQQLYDLLLKKCEGKMPNDEKGNPLELHVYCNDSFEPCKDDSMADIFDCFRVGNRLLFSYSAGPAFI